MKSIYKFKVDMVAEIEEKTKETRKNEETGKEEEIYKYLNFHLLEDGIEV